MDKKINLADLERENEQLRRQLAELDELPRKKGGRTVTDLKGVQNITTSVSKGIRAIPGERTAIPLTCICCKRNGRG